MRTAMLLTALIIATVPAPAVVSHDAEPPSAARATPSRELSLAMIGRTMTTELVMMQAALGPMRATVRKQLAAKPYFARYNKQYPGIFDAMLTALSDEMRAGLVALDTSTQAETKAYFGARYDERQLAALAGIGQIVVASYEQQLPAVARTTDMDAAKLAMAKATADFPAKVRPLVEAIVKQPGGKALFDDFVAVKFRYLDKLESAFNRIFCAARQPAEIKVLAFLKSHGASTAARAEVARDFAKSDAGDPQCAMPMQAPPPAGAKAN